MTRARAVDLRAADRRVVLAILAEHLPVGAVAWVFGSRATGRSRPYYDLDLAVDAGRPLTLDEIARLAEAFRNCDLSYRVDLVDWRGVGERFRCIIAAERIALYEREHSSSGS